jgi:hypothetical protein
MNKGGSSGSTPSPAPPCIRHIKLQLEGESRNIDRVLNQLGDTLETIDICTSLPGHTVLSKPYHWPKCNRLILRGKSITNWSNLLLRSNSSIPSLQQLELEHVGDFAPDEAEELRDLAVWTNSSWSSPLVSVPSIIHLHGNMDRTFLTMTKPYHHQTTTTTTEETSSSTSIVDHQEEAGCILTTITRSHEWKVETLIQPLSTLKSIHSLLPSTVRVHVPSDSKVLLSIRLPSFAR